MDLRDQRAILIAAMCQLDRQNGAWIVPSQTATGRKYTVTLSGVGNCNCPDHQAGFCCKHIRAVRIVLKRELRVDGSITETKEVTFETKKVYRQNWTAYNKAQESEYLRVPQMLSALVSGLKEPVRPTTKRGRKPHSHKDAITAMVLKVFDGKSSRRTGGYLADNHEKGFVSRKIPGQKLSAFFMNPELTPILKALVSFSALPLRVVETGFAVDSSGFSTSKFERWFDAKDGVERQKATWVKAHIACGVKTNVVPAIRILDKDAADCPQFEALVNRVAEGFCICEVYADKAYLSGDNVDLVFAHSAEPFIMPKSNTTGGIGGLFQRMFHRFQYDQEDFLKHYHLRSNVETAFDMVKMKFGERVRSRDETAMMNEVLCKFICHNLCVLNHEQHELGIEPDFWGKREAIAKTA